MIIDSGLLFLGHPVQGGPKKVSHYQMIKKSFLIVLKPVNEITFIRQIKSWIKHYNIICWD